MRNVAILFVLLLSACGSTQHIELTNGVLRTPERITEAWANEAIALIERGEVQTISCDTMGGDAVGSIKVADALLRSTYPIEIGVPWGRHCNSGGALLWFASPYKTATGTVALHIAGNPRTKLQNKELSIEEAKILARAGVGVSLQQKVLIGTWDKPYALNQEEASRYFKSPP